MRESNFELMRIVAIVMVLASHCSGTAFPCATHADALQNPFLTFARLLICQFAIVAVNLFVLGKGA